MAQRNGLSLIHCAERPIVDIVFVHGLFGKPHDTWTYKSSTISNSNSLPGTEKVKATSQSTDKQKARTSKLGFRSLFRRSDKSSAESPHDNGVSGRNSVQALYVLGADPVARESTQEHTGELFWPAELLPKVVPDSRIYVWGYDVDINHIFASASQATVFQHSMNLLIDLADCRISDQEKSRPLIFVAHSLGGIVVKDMLNASRAEVTYLKDILPATHGVVFLGTPHRGSQIASIGRIAQDITKILWKSPNTSVLRDLEVNSQTLDRVGRGFNQILVERELEIHSFREEKPTKGILVVNQFSSAIENGREVIGSINADHVNMTKFSGPLDIGFIRISNTLSRWVDDIKSKREVVSSNTDGSDYDYDHEVIKKWLDPVDFKAEMRALMDQPIFIHDRAISRIPAVENWQRSYGGFLNITADTGYGKTSYAASIARQISEECSQTNVLVGFAFCRGRTSSAIFRSLLWQFTQTGHMKSQHYKRMMQAAQEHATLEGQSNSRSDDRGVAFKELYEKLLTDHHQVTLILDAVDQCKSQEHLIRHVSLLASGLLKSRVQCRVLVTSQTPMEWPKAEQNNLLQHVTPITDIEMKEDARKFVGLSLQSVRPPLSETSQLVVQVKCSQAAGDGWPYVMHKLATEYDHEGRHYAAQKLEESVLEYRKDRFSELSVPTIESKRILAIALGGQGMHQIAETLQRQLLEDLQLNHPTNDTLISTMMNDLALSLADSEKWAEAKEVQLQLVDIWERGGEETAERLRTGIKNLAVTCSHLGELDDAERMLRQALERDIETYGDDMDRKSIVLDKINLGQILAQQKKWTEAGELQLSAVEASIRVFGLDNPFTLDCMSNAAWALQQQGEYEEAKKLQLQVLSGRTRLYGPNHPLTLKICGNLAETLSHLHEMDEARRYARRALGYYSAS